MALLNLNARLGSLAVKRVLGKDESPGSNPGLGFEFLGSVLVLKNPISPVSTLLTAVKNQVSSRTINETESVALDDMWQVWEQ